MNTTSIVKKVKHPKELNKLHNDYPLAPGKIEIKRDMLPNYQVFCNIPIGIVKKLVPNIFDKEKYVLHYQNLQLYFKLGLAKKIRSVLDFNQPKCIKSNVEFNTQKIIKEKKIETKMKNHCAN